MPHHKLALSQKLILSNQNKVIERFEIYVKTSRVRINDFFKFQDIMNHGSILADAFKNISLFLVFPFLLLDLIILLKDIKSLITSQIIMNVKKLNNSLLKFLLF
jgi:hypothetical protein